MDTSLCIYKEKLKEALSLVSTMSTEKQAEAVTYWNVSAEQLQDIVHKNESDFNTVLSQNMETRGNENQTGAYNNNAECQTSASIEQSDANIITNLSSNSTTDATTLESIPDKVDGLSQFHEGNLIEKTIFETTYLGESLVTSSMMEDGCKEHMSNLMNDKLAATTVSSLTTYSITQPVINCTTQHPSISPTTCSNSQGTSTMPSDAFTVLKHPSVITRVANNHIDANKTILNLSNSLSNGIYCTNVDTAQAGTSGHVISYVATNGTDLSPTGANKLNQSGLETDVNYNNVIVNNSLGCPRTRADMTNEIGNGQFDRGPKIFDNVDGFNHFDSNAQTITINPTAVSNTFIPSRSELFTHSDRPLQQIQLYSSNTGEYFNQPYTLINNRLNQTKYVYYNSPCNEQTDLLKDTDKPQDNSSNQHEEKDLTATKQDEPEATANELNEDESGLPKEPEGAKMLNNSSQHTCDVCGKSGFSTKGNLKRHLRAHSGEKPFKCEFCDSCFTEKKSLKIHVRRHTGEKPYKCEICGKLFSQTGVLQSHMALHLNERKFDCHKCGKAFRQRSQLKLHLMRHDGVKRLECSTCKAKFLTKGDLERHCRIHTGERPYACKICNKTFTRQQSLNEHMNRHTGRKPYDCKYCEKTFSEMSACYKHAKTHKRQEQAQRHPPIVGQLNS